MRTPPFPLKHDRYVLRNDAGDYLHMSATKMTTIRADAYVATAKQVAGAKRNLTIAISLKAEAAN